MNTQVMVSLPPEQLQLLESIKAQNDIIINHRNEHHWLTDEMVAKRLHCSATTLYRYRQSGELPFRQYGGNRLYVPSEVDEWMLNNKQA